MFYLHENRLQIFLLVMFAEMRQKKSVFLGIIAYKPAVYIDCVCYVLHVALRKAVFCITKGYE